MVAHACKAQHLGVELGGLESQGQPEALTEGGDFVSKGYEVGTQVSYGECDVCVVMVTAGALV